MTDKKIFPYGDGPQKRTEYSGFKMYEYLVPFNYENINVVRNYSCCEKHGMELNPVNSHYPDASQPPFDYIEIAEVEPIIRVEVIGSACTPPGYIQLMFEPCEGFYRDDEHKGIVAPRMRIDNLWGMHLRWDQWASRTPGATRILDGSAYEPLPAGHFAPFEHPKADSSEFPLVGFSCGVFSIPRSKSIRISGGSVTPGWVGDTFCSDKHYSFRIIRTTVCI